MIYLSFFILRASVQLQKLNSKQYHYRVKSNTSQCAKKSQIAGWTVNCLLRQKFCINSCRVEICTRFASTSGGLDKPSRAFEPTTEVFDSLILRDFHRPKKNLSDSICIFFFHFFSREIVWNQSDISVQLSACLVLSHLLFCLAGRHLMRYFWNTSQHLLPIALTSAAVSLWKSPSL